MILSRFHLNNIKQCSSSYRNLSKLSLKVYYFQEISKIVSSRNNELSFRSNGYYRSNSYPVDHYTFNEHDLKQLSLDINQSISELSPSQLLSTAISYSNLSLTGRTEWKRLCYAALKHVYGNCYNINSISPSHVSMILYSYARKFTNELPITNKLLASTVKSTGSLNERDINMILYYIRRTKSIPKSLETPRNLKNAKVLRAISLCLCKEGGNKLVKFTPSSLVSLVYNFSQIGMIPWSLIYHSCNLIKKHSGKLDLKSVGFHSRSLVHLKIRDKKTLETFISSLNTTKPIPIPTITSLLYSLAKLNYRPKSDISTLLSEIKRLNYYISSTNRSIVLFEDRDLAQVAYALGQLGIRATDVFESITSFLKTRIDYQSPQHLSMIIRAYSKVGIFDREAVELIVENSLKLMSGFSLPQIVCLMDSLVVLGYFDDSSFLKFLSYFSSFSSSEIPDYLLNQVNRIIYSIKLENREFMSKVPSHMSYLFDLYQGHFMLREQKDSNDSLFRTLKELHIPFRTGEKVGLYTPDAILENNVSLEMLSKGSICPLSGHILGSPQMERRHMALLGYDHVQISKDEWQVFEIIVHFRVRKSESQRRQTLKELLVGKRHSEFV